MKPWWIAAVLGLVAGSVLTALYVPKVEIVVERPDCVIVERE